MASISPEQAYSEYDARYQTGYELKTRSNFYKLGGTWDMVNINGRLVGSGDLDDAAILAQERILGLYGSTAKLDKPARILKGEEELSIWSYNQMRKMLDKGWGERIFDEDFLGLEEAEVLHNFARSETHFRPWCPDYGQFTHGPFIPLFSGDSSLIRAAINAPLTFALIEEGQTDPSAPINAAMGTDTTDLTIPVTYDVLAFDTSLPELKVTGSNLSHREPNSDAPRHFGDLARLTRVNLSRTFNRSSGPHYRSGAYYVFGGHVYQAADLIKLDPSETRKIEGHTTFYAPHRTSRLVSNILQDFVKNDGKDFTNSDEQDPDIKKYLNSDSAPDHSRLIAKLTLKDLFQAMSSVYTVDLGDQNSPHKTIAEILNPENRAIVIAAHSLGNSDNPLRWACVEAARQGKLVAVASRTIVGEVNQRYGGSMLDANVNSEELGRTKEKLLAGYLMNKTVVRALLVRALLEDLNQAATQKLFDNYFASRFSASGSVRNIR